MTLPRIIGIAGRAGAGKDTLADYFVREHGYVKLSFADPLKAKIKERFNLDDRDFALEEKEQPYECFGFEAAPDDEEPTGPDFSLRSWMQWLGTEFARKLFGEDCWVYLLYERMANYSEEQKFVISDVRFENEAEFVREEGGVLFHLVRPGLKDDDHTSEAGIATKEEDFVIFNDKSVAELEQGAAELLGIKAPVTEPAEFTLFNWDDYIEFVNSTWIEEQLDENAHAGFGLVEEAGEVAGIMKRLYRGDAPLDDAKLVKELGDVIYYWTKICDLYGLNPQNVIAANVEKITDRKERGVLRGAGGDR